MRDNEESSLARSWIRLGIVCGLVTVVLYPVLLMVNLPGILLVPMAGAFGPLLAVASIGTYHFIALHRRTVTVQLAVLFNIIAGVLVNLMMITQLSVNVWMRSSPELALGGPSRQILDDAWKVVNQVQLGMDISWDIFIAVGTLLFAVSMLGHPKLGRIFGWPGILIGAGILAFNFLTFPKPPAESGLFDLGPVMGLWYLAVGIKLILSLKWVDERLAVT
jgi:hypothetical protein